MGLQDLCTLAGRDAEALTRRDVARALLTVPAEDALESLPELRRGLLAAGRPLSAAFWTGTEELLSAIRSGAATIADVHRWLEATGSEPTRFLAGGFLWPEEDERGPVAWEMHHRLVAHLEEQVAAARIDPERLLAGDADELAAYEQAQLDWLTTPLEDGRAPMWAVSDEEDDEFLAAWDDAEADARQILTELLEDVGPRPCPQAELQAAATRLRMGLGEAAWPYDLLRAVGEVDPAELPDDDRELWLQLAAGVVTGGRLDPSDDLLDDDSHISWMMLEHPDWVAAVASLARLGPSAPADADALARYATTFDFEADEGDVAERGDLDAPRVPGFDDPFSADPDSDGVELSLSIGFHTVVRLWHLLGAVDDEERLTGLGWWGLPAALQHAWWPRDQDA